MSKLPPKEAGYRAELARLMRVYVYHKQAGHEACADGILEELYSVGQFYVDDCDHVYVTCVGGRARGYHNAGLCGCRTVGAT